MYGMSYANILLYSAAMPTYGDTDGNEEDEKGEKRRKWNPRLDASNPDNFKTETDDEEYI